MHSSGVRARAAAILAALLLGGCTSSMPKASISVRGQELTVEIARSEEERARGFMHRTSLGRRAGMLFVFQSDEHLTFWMKDTPLPLSIAFLSAEGRILEIQDMEPFSEKTIRSRFSARFALEVARGVFEEIGAREGDTVALPQAVR
jgi:uncharacterized membrane protein (UPF0127 family)